MEETSWTDRLERDIITALEKRKNLSVEEMKDIKEAVDKVSEEDNKFKQLSVKLDYMISLYE